MTSTCRQARLAPELLVRLGIDNHSPTRSSSVLDHAAPPPPEIQDRLSDRGCQYTSAQFATAATELGVRLSHGRKGQCWDNAVGESFFATIKTELLDEGVWPTMRSAETAIFEYIESGYSLHRRHSALGYLSPAAYEATATAVDLVA
jgi:transposase InsO family protein